MPSASLVQLLTLIVTSGVLIVGVIAWAERYVRGGERSDAENWYVQKRWNDGAANDIESFAKRLDQANEEMSKTTTRWTTKVAQLDEHLRAADLKAITLETIVAGVREQMRELESHLRTIEQHGCVYGQENRKQIEDLNRRRRP